MQPPAPAATRSADADQAAIVVAEALGLLRDSLVRGLSAWPHGLVHAAASLADAEALLRGGPALLLLDLELAGPDTAATLRRLRAEFPQVRIVALAGGFTPEAALLCLAAGAHGALAKTAAFEELGRAIESVHRGGIHVPQPAPAPSHPGTPPHTLHRAVPPQPGPGYAQALTGRQRDVLRLLAEGRSTKDIARTLDLAVSTIKVHLAAVYRTVGARNRVEALCRAGALVAAAP